jgi:hypothetical protein
MISEPNPAKHESLIEAAQFSLCGPTVYRRGHGVASEKPQTIKRGRIPARISSINLGSKAAQQIGIVFSICRIADLSQG